VVVKEISYEIMDCICLVQDRGLVVGCCEHGNEPSVYIKAGGSNDPLVDC
jgi:hypothetical protein